ncbi:hypothetical protein [Kribbella sp. NPDC048928]|uniref:hypothetical protein n=1 Tax=Kribbella sp. NPDC048928 TaxID=3364111 RepID=UPI003715F854
MFDGLLCPSGGAMMDAQHLKRSRLSGSVFHVPEECQRRFQIVAGVGGCGASKEHCAEL